MGKTINDILPKIVIVIIFIVGWLLLMWGICWVVKILSYWFFYEDMVQATVREMVDSKYLIPIK